MSPPGLRPTAQIESINGRADVIPSAAEKQQERRRLDYS
jgi:hypothetical protein